MGVGDTSCTRDTYFRLEASAAWNGSQLMPSRRHLAQGWFVGPGLKSVHRALASLQALQTRVGGGMYRAALLGPSNASYVQKHTIASDVRRQTSKGGCQSTPGLIIYYQVSSRLDRLAGHLKQYVFDWSTIEVHRGPLVLYEPLLSSDSKKTWYLHTCTVPYVVRYSSTYRRVSFLYVKFVSSFVFDAHIHYSYRTIGHPVLCKGLPKGLHYIWVLINLGSPF